LIEAEKASFPVSVMCRALGVKPHELSRLGAARAVWSGAV
jgi:hypothetical protein